MNAARKLRITVLLLILAAVALDAWYTNRKLTDWEEPLWLMIFPIYGDNSERTRRYLERLGASDFAPIEEFMARELVRYGGNLARPVEVKLAPPDSRLPPLPPPSGGMLATALWSFDLRGWANDAEDRVAGPKPDIRLFVIYHDPQLAPAVPHSLGLQKGLVGIVHAFADRRQRGSNQVIITHEMLHTLGATDKYDPTNNLPLWPDGFAEPGSAPNYPQSMAEIMAGRIPTNPTRAEIPDTLQQTLIGNLTASEINFRR